MFRAGSDTSSVTLEWALSLLLRHPHVMRKAQEELDSKVGWRRVVEESDIPQLTYLQAIVKETLCFYPAAPLLLPQKSEEACTVGGYHIPAETIMMSFDWFVPVGRVLDMNEGVSLVMPRAGPLEVMLKPRLSHHLY
ncbi:hypothetical protein SUGI_1189500 [Cryptomeria japonica]|nr:hypothetical protein SUGI_1189500 [Cryptomeria japonica]